MDPNKSGQLDPKLKEAYDRVMNATVTPPAGQSPPPPPPPPAAPNPVSPPGPLGTEHSATLPPPPPPPLASPNIPVKPFTQDSPRPDITSTPFSGPLHNPDPVVSTTSSGTIASKFPAYKAGTLKAGRGGNVPTILWVLLAAVFFIAYTLIWIRVLGVSLPFLP